jgi:hypothetical protein
MQVAVEDPRGGAGRGARHDGRFDGKKCNATPVARIPIPQRNMPRRN